MFSEVYGCFGCASVAEGYPVGHIQEAGVGGNSTIQHLNDLYEVFSTRGDSSTCGGVKGGLVVHLLGWG